LKLKSSREDQSEPSAPAFVSTPSDLPTAAVPNAPTSSTRRYWDGRFILVNLILMALALVAAYLEYSVYPAIMNQSFGETGILLRLSPLTFRLDGTRCYQTCQTLVGIPSLDFFQIFLIALVAVNLAHFFRLRGQKTSYGAP